MLRSATAHAHTHAWRRERESYESKRCAEESVLTPPLPKEHVPRRPRVAMVPCGCSPTERWEEMRRTAKPCFPSSTLHSILSFGNFASFREVDGQNQNLATFPVVSVSLYLFFSSIFSISPFFSLMLSRSKIGPALLSVTIVLSRSCSSSSSSNGFSPILYPAVNKNFIHEFAPPMTIPMDGWMDGWMERAALCCDGTTYQSRNVPYRWRWRKLTFECLI